MFASSGIEEEDIQPAIGSCGDPDTITEGTIWVEEVIVHTGYAIGTQEYTTRYTIRTAKAKIELFLPHILKVDAELMYTTFISYRLGEFKYKPNWHLYKQEICLGQLLTEMVVLLEAQGSNKKLSICSFHTRSSHG